MKNFKIFMALCALCTIGLVQPASAQKFEDYRILYPDVWNGSDNPSYKVVYDWSNKYLFSCKVGVICDKNGEKYWVLKPKKGISSLKIPKQGDVALIKYLNKGYRLISLSTGETIIALDEYEKKYGVSFSFQPIDITSSDFFIKGNIISKDNYHYWLFDRKGKLLFTEVFDEINFSLGDIAVVEDFKSSKTGKIEFVNADGKVLNTLMASSPISDFSPKPIPLPDGTSRRLALLKQIDGCFAIDSMGNKVASYPYTKIEELPDDSYGVRDNLWRLWGLKNYYINVGEKRGVFNLNDFKEIIPPLYDEIGIETILADKLQTAGLVEKDIDAYSFIRRRRDGVIFTSFFAVKLNDYWGAYGFMHGKRLVPENIPIIDILPGEVVAEASKNMFSVYIRSLNLENTKGWFETTAEFEARQNDPQLQTEYVEKNLTKLLGNFITKVLSNKQTQCVYVLSGYDADHGEFTFINHATPLTDDYVLPVPLDKAEDFRNNFAEIQQKAQTTTEFFIFDDVLTIASVTFTGTDGTQYKYEHPATKDNNCTTVCLEPKLNNDKSKSDIVH